VTTGRKARFPGAPVMAERRGPDGGDCGGRWRGDGVVPMVEERDDVVPRHDGEDQVDGVVAGCGGEGQADDAIPGRSDGMEAVEVTMTWTQRRRRRRMKFRQLDGVQVKILRLGFKDRAAVGFRGGPQ
jgi:hypothetical protein